MLFYGTRCFWSQRLSIEVIEYEGTRYAEVMWAGARVEKTTFFSPPDSSMQFGLLAHGAGYIEEPHYHQAIQRTISDLQQMFVVQRGVVAVDLYDNGGSLLRTVTLSTGDAILLVNGVHAIRVLEDMQCISVKQGPFLGLEFDKVIVNTNK
jgi:hypothetical protein